MAAGQSTTVNEQLLKALHRCSGNIRDTQRLRVYLDAATYDLASGAMRNMSFRKANEIFRDELQQCGIQPRFQVYNDGHQWANGRDRTEDILRCFFPQTAQLAGRRLRKSANGVRFPFFRPTLMRWSPP